MNVESIQDYVGDEDCFNKGRHWIPNQYFKCLETDIEMIFSFNIGSGWCVGPPIGQSSIPVLKSPQKYAQQEREFYDQIKKIRELD